MVSLTIDLIEMCDQVFAISFFTIKYCQLCTGQFIYHLIEMTFAKVA